MDVAMKKNSKSPISENGSQLIYDANHNIILDDEKVCIRYDVMGRAYKRCGYCKKWKPVGSFEKSSSPLSKDGYGSFCDVCRSKQKKGVVPQAEGKPVQTEKKATAQTNKPRKTRRVSSSYVVTNMHTGKIIERNGKPVEEEMPKSPATDDMLAEASTFALIRELERRGCKMQISVSIPPDALVTK